MKLLRFHRLVRRHRDAIYAHAFAMLGNRQDAEDVAQEAFIRLWQAMEHTRLKKEKSWLMKVTHNLCLDWLRKRQRTGAGNPAAVEENGEELLGSNAEDPHKAAERHELSELIADALRSLPETPRAVTVLREIDGLSYREISEVLGIPLNSVKVHLHRGRRRLRELLAPYVSEGGKISEV